MHRELTLRLDEDLIRTMKRISEKSGKPVSQMVAEYFALVDEVDPDQRDLTPSVRSLYGALAGTGVSDEDYRQHHLETTMYQKLLDFLAANSAAPPLYEPGEPAFWNDPHISSGMLKAHLDPTGDAASRRPETIDQTVTHWFDTGLLKPGMKVLDLGCGPGLYAERLARAGAVVVGLDISERSVEYARGRAAEAQLPIEYHCMDFFTMEYIDTFDIAIQVYGELCAFSAEKRATLLRLIHRALKQEGQFIFDVTTRELRMRKGLQNGWYMSNGGFWRPGRHLVLEQGYDYPAASVWLDQYVVIDDRDTTVYRNWFHDYSLDSLNSELKASGFVAGHVWGDLTGSAFTEGGDWIAVAASKSP